MGMGKIPQRPFRVVRSDEPRADFSDAESQRVLDTVSDRVAYELGCQLARQHLAAIDRERKAN